MFYLMKLEPNLFLVAREPMKPRALEVPLQVPMRHISLRTNRQLAMGQASRDEAALARKDNFHS